MTGTVDKAILPKGYAFVAGDDGRDYFLHVDDWTGVWDARDLRRGVRVEFETREVSPDRYRAMNARAVVA